jgi:hypothetical protein
MDLLFILVTLAVVPFWLLLLVAATRPAAVRAVHTIWVFVAFGALYVVLLAMGDSASAESLLTLDGYKELQTSDVAVLAGWVHYLSLDLFVGAWLARDAARFDIPRSIVVVCLLLTFALAPLGIAVYLLVRAKRTGSVSIDAGEGRLATA